MPVPIPSGQVVARFLGRGDEPDLVARADEHLPLVTAFVRAYTRGRGFSQLGHALTEDLNSVIIGATARLVTNPAQLERETSAEYTAVGSFAGWTLPELAVLHAYRRRTA